MLVVSLNPCLDKTAELDAFQWDSANRVRIVRTDTGGKGVNAAVMLHTLKEEVTLIGFDFPKSNRPVRKIMEEKQIPFFLFDAPGLLRTNLKIHDLSRKITIEINEQSEEIPKESLLQLEEKLFSQAKKGEWVILTGSLPKGVPQTVYRDWCRKLKEKGCLVAVDADGEVLHNALSAHPDFMKPNDQEFARLTGKENLPDEEKIAACRKLMADNELPCVCLSMGKKGAYLFTKKETYFAEALPVPVKSVHAAGDAALSGILSAFSQGKDPADALRFGIASSNATVQEEGTEMGRYDEFLRLLPLVRCRCVK